jgi:predicted ATPase
MSDATFLTRVVIENYKSIAACDLRLGPLTFLVGPNGAGKSNFLDALHFVNDSLVHSLDQALRLRGGSRQLLHHPAGMEARWSLRLEFTLPSRLRGSYSFRIGHTKVDARAWRWEVLEEQCRVGSSVTDPNAAFFRVQGGQVLSSVGTVPAATPDSFYLVRASGLPEFREV